MASRFTLGLLGSVLCGACGVAPVPDADDEAAGSTRQAISSQIGRSAWLFYDGSRVIDRTSYNSANLVNSVARTGTGMYEAVLPGMWPGTTQADENVQISVVEQPDYSAAFCSVRTTGVEGSNLRVWVGCYDRSGAPANAAFYLSNLDFNKPAPGLFNPRGVGVIAEVAGGSTGCTVFEKFAWQQDQCTRLAAGYYKVNLAGQTQAGGTVLLTASQSRSPTPGYCNVERWATNTSGTDVYIRCFAAGGVPLDTSLYLQYRRTVIENYGGFVWAQSPSSSRYVPSSSYNDRFDSCSSTPQHDIYVEAMVPSIGQYLVGYPFLAEVQGPRAVHTTPYGSAATYCRLGGEAFRLGIDPALRTQVNCYDPSGLRVDSKFTQLAIVNATPSCH
jgi:hypothetical protein